MLFSRRVLILYELTIPTKEGYTFSHWEVTGTNASVNDNKLTIGTTNTEVTAIYNGNEYSITYNLDGGNEIDNLETSGVVGTEITLPIPTKEGWTFTGWSVLGKNSVLNDNKLTIGIENLVLTANWELKFTDHITNILASESTLNNGLFVDDTADKNIRYRGATPNNYVYFNCKDKDSNNVEYGETNYDYASSCEVWRIIGVFDVAKTKGGTTEKRIKIVRDAFSVAMSWDSSSNNGGTDNNSGLGINQWGKSIYADGSEYEGADLMRMLNTYYIGVENATCTYCNDENQGTCENNCSSSVTPLSTTSLNMIEEALWYTGAQNWISDMPVTAMYTAERGTQKGKICSSTSTDSNGTYMCTDTLERTTTWEGLVGLIYPSDYGYASTDAGCASDIVNVNSTCENNNWLHPTSSYWTISPYADSDYSNLVWRVNPSRSVSADHASTAGGVRPAAYLASDVQIIGGDGNMTPFKLSA